MADRYFSPRVDELAQKAANPDSMGGHGQPTGRPSCPDEGRDHNHPQPGGHYEHHESGDFSKHSQGKRD